MGIPSILYPDYGCEEWIVDGKDGFIVDNISQAVDVIKKLINNKGLLESVSRQSMRLSKVLTESKKLKTGKMLLSYMTYNVFGLKNF